MVKPLLALGFIAVIIGVCCGKSLSSEPRNVHIQKAGGSMKYNFYLPLKEADDWRQLLAEPETQWRDGYSAKSLAVTWLEADGFPKSIKNIFKKTQFQAFKNMELLAAYPEYPVPLPGGGHASQNDIFVLAKGDKGLVSVMVEGKVSEDFGETVQAWKAKLSAGKKQRLDFMVAKLGLEAKIIDPIRYQLLHRTVSSIIEAERYTAPNALVLIHSFSASHEHFDDYVKFLALFNVVGEKESIVGPIKISGIDVYFCWATDTPPARVTGDR